MRSIVPTKELFKMVFNAYTGDFFKGVDLCGKYFYYLHWKFGNLNAYSCILIYNIGAVITGGSVTSALQPLDSKVLNLYYKYSSPSLFINY